MYIGVIYALNGFRTLFAFNWNNNFTELLSYLITVNRVISTQLHQNKTKTKNPYPIGRNTQTMCLVGYGWCYSWVSSTITPGWMPKKIVDKYMKLLHFLLFFFVSLHFVQMLKCSSILWLVCLPRIYIVYYYKRTVKGKHIDNDDGFMLCATQIVIAPNPQPTGIEWIYGYKTHRKKHTKHRKSRAKQSSSEWYLTLIYVFGQNFNSKFTYWFSFSL